MSEPPSIVLHFKYASHDELLTMKGGGCLRCVGVAIDRIAHFISTTAGVYKHVEISIPTKYLMQSKHSHLLGAYSFDPEVHRFFSFGVVAFDESTNRSGVFFRPRTFENYMYTHVEIPLHDHAMIDRFVLFATAVRACDPKYTQFLSDVYLMPGYEDREGWYCVALTTAVLQKMGMFEGIPQTEMSTMTLFHYATEVYGGTGAFSAAQYDRVTGKKRRMIKTQK